MCGAVIEMVDAILKSHWYWGDTQQDKRYRIAINKREEGMSGRK